MSQNKGLVYNSPSPSSQVMSLMMSSIQDGGEKSHTKLGDDVTTTLWDTPK